MLLSLSLVHECLLVLDLDLILDLVEFLLIPALLFHQFKLLLPEAVRVIVRCGCSDAFLFVH